MANIAEWGITKLFSSLFAWVSKLWAKKKDNDALSTNQTNLEAAIKTGDQGAITKAAEDSLNNTHYD